MLKIILACLFLGVGAAQAVDNPGVSIINAVNASLSGTTFSASTTTSQTVVLSANKFRRYLRVTNLNSSVPIYLGFTPSISASASVAIAGGATYEPVKAPTNALYFFTGSSTASGVVFSGN